MSFINIYYGFVSVTMHATVIHEEIIKIKMQKSLNKAEVNVKK